MGHILRRWRQCYLWPVQPSRELARSFTRRNDMAGLVL